MKLQREITLAKYSIDYSADVSKSRNIISVYLSVGSQNSESPNKFGDASMAVFLEKSRSFIFWVLILYAWCTFFTTPEI